MAANLAAIGCPRDRIRVVKIGIDLSKFAFEPRVRSGPLILMQTARLVEKKGVDTSIRSFAAAHPRLGASELWIVGDGPLRASLEDLANSLGIGSSVRFLGELSHQDYIRATQDAHICIQPSRTARDGDTEGGAPTVLLEMQALGVAVVTTRHADIPTVVAEPGDLPEEKDTEGVAAAIVRAAETPEDEWIARLARARAFVVREHDAGVTARQHEELYREAMATVGAQRSRR
jgi:glycosyltransferase involved in cell wall biosynthesis